MRQVFIINFFFSIGSSKNYVAVIVGFMLVAACKKDNNKQLSPGQFENLRVKTMSGADAAAGREVIYTYDAKNRIIKETQILHGTVTEKISNFSYSGNKLAIERIENNTISYRYFELTPQGYLKADTASGGVIYFYHYNDKGFLTKVHDNQLQRYERNYYYSTTTGLLDSTRATVGGVWNNSQTYTYDMNRVNSLDEKNFGMLFYGNLILRPFTHYEYKYADGGVIKKQVIDYQYTYDEKQRIKSKSYETAGQRLTYHYTYY